VAGDGFRGDAHGIARRASAECGNAQADDSGERLIVPAGPAQAGLVLFPRLRHILAA
jgi:hypothetical protein